MGKKIPVWQILLLIVVMVGALMFTVLKKEGYMHGILAMVLCLACIIAMLNGYKWSYLQSAMINKISSSMEAVLIFITVGMLVAMWISGGIVQAMIYYGLKILSPQIFLVASCILCAIVAIATGSSWTTAGTIGVALMGIGVTMGISAPLVAGSIISGAYLGDKMSPLSDTTNLAPAMAGAKLFDHIGHMVWTVTPSLIVSLIIYFILGLGVDTSSATTSDIEALQQVLKDNFNLNPLLFIAPILVVVMAIKAACPGIYLYRRHGRTDLCSDLSGRVPGRCRMLRAVCRLCQRDRRCLRRRTSDARRYRIHVLFDLPLPDCTGICRCT